MNSNTLKQNLPTIALVGRVNVGKSTLFNKLIEKEEAVVSNQEGTTRTRNRQVMWWRGEPFQLIDTGGIELKQTEDLEEEIYHQVELAVEQADLIVFVTDGKEGLTSQEEQLAKKIQKTGKRTVLVINKIDNKRIGGSIELNQWFRLGLGEPILISAKNGRSVGDFLDEVYDKLDQIIEKKEQKKEKEIVNTGLIGKPNVGKSSLFNKLVDKQEVIVNSEPHTTREPFDTTLQYSYKKSGKEHSQWVKFIDTAGIRKQKNVESGIEQKGVKRSIEAVQKSDLVLFVIDGSEPISKQDKKLGSVLKNNLKSIIIIINKWDLAEKDTQEKRQIVKQMIYQEFPHLDFTPVMFVSAKTGYNVNKIFPNINKAWEARKIFIPEDALDSFLRQAIKKNKPTKGKGTKYPKLVGMKQVNQNPPVFELYMKQGAHLADSYLNYLKNRLREQFNFFATPIRIKLIKVK
jgi:GTP-binding protein